MQKEGEEGKDGIKGVNVCEEKVRMKERWKQGGRATVWVGGESGRKRRKKMDRERRGEKERERETDVRASMTDRNNLIIILMWDVMNTHTHTHPLLPLPLPLVQRHKPSSPPPTTLPKVSTSAFITWNNTLPCVHSSVPLRLMHCTGLQESFSRLLSTGGDCLRVCLGRSTSDTKSLWG